jgi:hypothetical protein
MRFESLEKTLDNYRRQVKKYGEDSPIGADYMTRIASEQAKFLKAYNKRANAD